MRHGLDDRRFRRPLASAANCLAFVQLVSIGLWLHVNEAVLWPNTSAITIVALLGNLPFGLGYGAGRHCDLALHQSASGPEENGTIGGPLVILSADDRTD